MAETTIAEQLERLSTAKANLRQSIIAKQPNDVTFSATRLDEYPAEVDKIKSTSSLTGATIVADDILEGKVAYGNNGVPITGTIETISVSPTEIKAKDTIIAVGKGYNPEAKTIQIAADEQAKIAAENIKDGVTILGTNGTFSKEETDPITAPYVFHGLVGFVNGEKVIGTMPEYNGEKELLFVDTKLVNDTIIVPQNVKFPSSNSTYLYFDGIKGSTEYKVGASKLKVQLSRTDSQRNYQLKSFVGNSFIAQSQIYQFPKLFDELYPEGTGFFTQENKNTIIWNIPFVNFPYPLEHEDMKNGTYKIKEFSDLNATEIFNLYYDYEQTEANKATSNFHYGEDFYINSQDFNKDLYFTTQNARLSIFGVPFPIKKGKIRVDTIIGQVYLSYQLPCDIMYEASPSNFQPVVSGTYSNSLSWSDLPSDIQSGTMHTIKVIPTGLDYISKGFITTMHKGVN